VSKLWSERENQQDATVRCLLSILSYMFRTSLYPSSGDKDMCYCKWCAALVLLDVVGSGCGALRCRMRALCAPYNTAPHNRYQPHPAEPAQHTTCSNTCLYLLKMGIMMSETCWESIDNKHLTVASCWFSLSLHSSNSVGRQRFRVLFRSVINTVRQLAENTVPWGHDHLSSSVPMT